jgi:hypothetical protein
MQAYSSFDKLNKVFSGWVKHAKIGRIQLEVLFNPGLVSSA